MAERMALVAGATGAVAKRLIELLAGDPAWSVVGLSRNPPSAAVSVRWVAADLGDAVQCRRALAEHSGITHVFYCARAEHGEGGVESVEDNVALLRNLLDGVEHAARDLRHVHLVEGGKWYGLHLGRYPTPAREDDPRHMPPNFYYGQEDLLRARQEGRGWTWSASRPNVICDFAPERPRNLVSIIGAYAAISAELGLQLDFPGKPGNFTALTELTDAGLLARGMVHMATSPACANKAFNITNGDVIRWERLWPRIARLFGLEPGIVRPLPLARWMEDKQPVWARIVAKYGLVPKRLDEVARWGFADFVFGQDYDVISDLNRLRRAGFHETIDTGEMLLGQLQQYRDARILP
ncbi:MAG: SDR family oxidoreductase [Hyphomicrobiaceae bacterium]|nr:SDR family oxidoreductase [Hyphomicrobiaceae bacterium]